MCNLSSSWRWHWNRLGPMKSESKICNDYGSHKRIIYISNYIKFNKVNTCLSCSSHHYVFWTAAERLGSPSQTTANYNKKATSVGFLRVKSTYGPNWLVVKLVFVLYHDLTPSVFLWDSTQYGTRGHLHHHHHHHSRYTCGRDRLGQPSLVWVTFIKDTLS